MNWSKIVLRGIGIAILGQALGVHGWELLFLCLGLNVFVDAK